MKTIFAPRRRRSICGIIALCAMTAGILGAQSPTPRIRSEISSSYQTFLKGSQHPLAQAQNDVGRVPADTRLNGIGMYFSRSAAQEADLQALLAAQQDPASPLYHKWLTPDQFAARFGMAQSDIDHVSSWLQQQGFSIDSVARSRNAIRFSGTVGQVESAFSTQMHYYNVAGSKHFAPSTALSLPAAMAPAVAAVRNLDDFRPRAQHIVPRSAFTSGQTGNVFFAPADIATVYDIKPLYSAGVNGAGQTIVVVGQSSVTVGDIEDFQNAAGLTKKDPDLVLVPGTGSSQAFSGDQGESDIDLEWSGATAPGANIVFVYTGSNTTFNVYDSVQYAVDERIGSIISMSYASCEPDLSASVLASLEAMFSQAAAQGQTVFAASGDQGATACFVSPTTTNPTLATQEQVAVNYPASSAYVTGMGGTEITQANSTSSNSTYWTGGSSTSDTLNSAVTYIPEVAWNDDSSQFGLSASGGGASALVSRPAWQSGVPGIPGGSFRLVPDVSLYSSAELPGYLFCTSDQSNWNTTKSPFQTASCNSGFRDASTGLLTVAGGTSFSTPIFAGMLALINQSAGYVTGQGLINPTLYKLAADSGTYASAFHDVTSGNNNCTAGSTYCSSTTGFSAGTGYDEVTGLGSVDMNNLAAAWPVNTGASAFLIGTTTTVTAANSAPHVNTDDVVTITVASKNGSTTPTGTVVIKIDGGSDCGGFGASQGCGGTTLTAQPLTANGTLTYTANFATAGVHQVLAQYSGDTTHAASVGFTSVTVAGISTGSGTFKLAATDVSVNRGNTSSSTITVTPAGGYTGTVNISFSASNATALANLCYAFTTTLTNGDGSVAVTGTAATTTQLTLDTNAADCVSPTGHSQKGWRRLNVVHGGNSSRNTGTNPVPAGLAFAGLLLAGFLGRSSRKLRNLACVIALVAAGFALTACSSSNVNSNAQNPPKGTYIFTLTGTDSVTATNAAPPATFTFTIN